MSNYTQTTFFAPKDSLSSGNPAKLIKGADVDPELANIATAIATKFDATSLAASPVSFGAGTVGLPSIYFSTNTTSGLYQVAANQLGVSISGANLATFSSTGLALSRASDGNLFVIQRTGGTNNPVLTASVTDSGGNVTLNVTGTTASFTFQTGSSTALSIDNAQGVTATRLSVTSSTVPANGIYLSAANQLGFSSNTTARGSISSGGVWTLVAATTANATTLNVSGTSNPGTGALYVISGTGSAASGIDLLVGRNGSTANAAGQGANLQLADTTNTNATYLQNSGGQFEIWQAKGGPSFKQLMVAKGSVTGSVAAALSFYGETAAGQVDLTPDTGTFTFTLTGFTANPTATATWSRVGKLVTINLALASATSNATTMTLTGVPAAIQPSTVDQVATISSAEDSGANTVAAVAITHASGTWTLYKGVYGGAWTGSGTKGLAGAATFSYILN